jgi:SOS-response transcriptional repressor LexA
MIGLTSREAQLLAFIKAYKAENDGVAPNFDEMKAALGLASKCSIHRLLVALEERGRIVRLPHQARAIDVVEPPRIPSAAELALLPQEDLRELAARVSALVSAEQVAA